MSHCKITLDPLTKPAEQQAGYSNKALKTLAGKAGVSPRLPFDQRAFEHQLPKETTGMSISGFQPKLQLVVDDDRFNVIKSQGSHILKPSPKDFPHLAENEHATMVVMHRLGFEVPPNGLLEFPPVDEQAVELTYVIKRYDRDDQGKPLHQVQMDGSMGIKEKFGKTRDDGEQYVSYEQVGQFIMEHVDRGIKSRLDYFGRVALSYLLGNNDAHLRNFGILEGPRDRLAPVYDFVSVAPYPEYFQSCYLALPLLIKEEGGKELASGFNTEFGQYIGADFIEFGEGLGLKPALIKAQIQALISKRDLIEQTYRDSFMPLEHVEAVLSCFNSRAKAMLTFEAVPI
ncbi:serine/threonine-protein kinase HipA [Ferrimonas marina]|uniref:Serine/threonine-protein kinase HipA n=1 Tax=Ferrimonas marina TaxID=299255 RepID=A0A1M5TRQ6_9GAMM|nr:serine/threonine-protein kinase HipA [Ferrimonas marina]